MATMKDWWYKMVAASLVRELNESKQSCTKLRNDYFKVVKDLKESEVHLKNELAVFNRKIDALKSLDPIARTLNANRHNAAQQRIRDLEREVEHLRKRLVEANEN